jgi:hypothetical protein
MKHDMDFASAHQSPLPLRVIFESLRPHQRLPILRQQRTSPVSAATSEKCQTRKWFAVYSITSSARPSIIGDILMPSAFAVVALMINKNLVGKATGKSAGLAPLRILST